MQQNINPYSAQIPYQNTNAANPNAVSINIYQPQAFDSKTKAPQAAPNFYPLYQQNQNPNLPLYPMNYNNLIQPYAQNPINEQNPQTKDGNSANAYDSTNLIGKTDNPNEEKKQEAQKTDKKDKEDKKKEITILTDDYIKSLENYLNDSNPKVRLLGAKDVMERFKEDDSRASNPSLNALLNKMLRDTSPSVRFLGLTTLQLGYSLGNDETINILKEIQANNKDKLGEDALLASEILLKLSTPKIKEVKE